jgi:hypothetical protein
MTLKNMIRIYLHICQILAQVLEILIMMKLENIILNKKGVLTKKIIQNFLK